MSQAIHFHLDIWSLLQLRAELAGLDFKNKALTDTSLFWRYISYHYGASGILRL